MNGVSRPLRSRLRTIGTPIIVAGALFVIALPAALFFADVVDDEGYLTFIMARIVGQEPLAGLFYLKTRPAISLVYAVPAMLGWKVFLAAHVAVASLGVLLFVRAIQRLGGREQVAAWVFVLSPVFVYGAVAGYLNTDGLAVLAIAFDGVVHADSRFRRVWAGLAIAAGFLSRYELAPFFASLWLFVLFQRKDLLVASATVLVGVVYGLAGAVYHEDIEWFVRFGPHFATPPSYYREDLFSSAHSLPEQLAFFMTQLVSVTPFWLLPIATRKRDLPPLVRWLLVGGGISLLTVVLLPWFGIIGYQLQARYLLFLLPCAALSAAFVPQEHRRFLWLLPLIPLSLSPWWGWTNTLIAGPAFLAPVLATLWMGSVWWPALPDRLGIPPWTRSITIFAALTTTAIVAFFQVSFRADLLRDTRKTMDFLESTIEPRSAIFTNVHGLGPGLEARGHAFPVFFLPNHLMLLELRGLTNPANGQRARVARAVESCLYGQALWPCKLREEGPRAGDLLVLFSDCRTDMVFPISQWLAESERIGVAGSIEVRRFVRAPERTPPSTDLAAQILDYPCDSRSPN